MELVRYTAPFNCDEFLHILEKVFGEEESLLEEPQLNGSEVEYNMDIAYIAKEGEKILGTIHATIPKKFPELCGISAMCTTTDARGKGIGKKLFAQIVKEIDNLGVKVAVLGTGNPIAAKLYSTYGFGFLSGSCVMARFVEGAEVDFTRKVFMEESSQIDVLPGTARMRIQMIPLVLHKGSQLILDCNTNIVNCNLMTQTSCMGLYPRYLKLQETGGNFWGAYNEKGVLGAMASVMPTSEGMRADFFFCDSFERIVPSLLKKCKEFCGEFYLQFAKNDLRKQEIAKQSGFTEGEEIEYSYKNIKIPCVKYIR